MTHVPNSALTKVADIKLLVAALEKPENEFPAASMVAMTATIDVLYARALLLKHRLRRQAAPATRNGVDAD
jgi:DNA-binding MurR/RpiR family transcriptional regulator